jgi:viroplasmin and RNaseH domain-containing protein
MSTRPLWVTWINAHKQTDGITNNTFTIYNKIEAEKHYIEKKNGSSRRCSDNDNDALWGISNNVGMS